ncbi:MAG: zinc ABC transporter substrate-binding protein [Rikenellaceae bacterium]|nr:zinc ABC transporter substrate-binding protein [Rikenellaceae bacterium]
MRKLLMILLTLVVGVGCTIQSASDDRRIVVSINPLRYIVEGIVGDDFEVVTLVPPGASPETYELTPAQMEQVEHSQMVVGVGLMGFEQTTVNRVASAADVRYVSLSEGLAMQSHHCAHGHAYGVNPHLWTSPRKLREMAAAAYRAISEVWPDSVQYKTNYEALNIRLDSLDVRVARRLAEAPSRAFVIYHPTFGYLAEEYGLVEIAVENHGKEPSADHLRRVVDEAREHGACKVFYQREFPRSVVETVARELGVEPIEVDILESDVEAMILNFADKLAR